MCLLNSCCKGERKGGQHVGVFRLRRRKTVFASLFVLCGLSVSDIGWYAVHKVPTYHSTL